MKKAIIKLYSRKLATDIEKWKADPIGIQQHIFQNFLKIISNTEIGRQYEIHKIKSYEDYKRNVPLQTFETIKPLVQKIRDNKKDIMIPGLPKYLIMTAGTTSGKKFIPATAHSFGHYYQGFKDVFFNYLHQSGNFQVLNGTIITLTGSPVLDDMGKIKSGRISSVMNHQVPWYLKGNRFPGLKIGSISNWEEKMDLIIKHTLGTNVTGIVGLPIWVQRFFDLVKERENRPICEVFPNFQFFIHGGLNIKPYSHKLINTIGKEIDFIEVYNASEGFFGFQDRLDQPMLLHLNTGVFYEFIPEEEVHSTNPTRLSLAEVEIDVNYALIVNSYAGLFSYNMADTIKFVSLSPPRISLTGRTEHFTSAFNEHLISEDVEQAIDQACMAHNAKITEFTVAPQVNPSVGKPHHQWYIEFEIVPSEILAFKENIEKTIQSRNHLYRELVAAKVLSPLKIKVLQKNSFFNYMKTKNKLGGQFKVPRLLNNRSFAEELEHWVEKTVD